MKAGCFDNYPSHSNDPYAVKKSKGGDGTEKRIFRPSQGSKSTPTRSIINQNVERRINNLNFRQPITVSIWCDTQIEKKVISSWTESVKKLYSKLDKVIFGFNRFFCLCNSLCTMYIFFFVFWCNIPLKVISFYHVCFYNTAMK